MSEYTQGICDDGAAILCDGQPLTIEEILQGLRQRDALVAENYQALVVQWVNDCFGSEIADHKPERNHRFLEESLELVQSLGCSGVEAHKLVDYVFSRPAGDSIQEVGGVMVTLAALCGANEIDMFGAGYFELTRINRPDTMNKIRAKHNSKPAMSPLPGTGIGNRPSQDIDLDLDDE